jgi:hypothetical protein
VNNSIQRWTVNLLLTAAFCVSAVGVLGANTWDQRLGQTSWWRNCYYDLVNNAPKQRKIIFLGTSRTRLGINPDQISKALDLPQGSVANLATTGRTPDFQYAVMEEVTKSPNVKLVMVELSISSQHEINTASKNNARRAQIVNRPSGINTPAAIRIADFDHIQSATQNLPFFTHAHDMVQIFLNKWSINFQSNVRRMAEISGILPVRTSHDTASKNICRETQNVGAQNTMRSIIAASEISNYDHNEPLSNFFLKNYPRHNYVMIEKMSALAAKRNFEIIFFQMPTAKFKPSTQADIDKFEKQYRRKLIIPNAEFMRKFEMGGYSDQVHMSENGASVMSHWMAYQIQNASKPPKL